MAEADERLNVDESSTSGSRWTIRLCRVVSSHSSKRFLRGHTHQMGTCNRRQMCASEVEACFHTSLREFSRMSRRCDRGDVNVHLGLLFITSTRPPAASSVPDS